MSPAFGFGFSSATGQGGVAKPNGSPSGLALTNATPTSLTLTWTVGSTNLDGSYVYVSTDGSTYTLKATLSGSTNTYTPSDLTHATLYYFYVVEYKGTKVSTSSNIASEETIYLPSDIANLWLWLDPTQLTGLNDGDMVASDTDFSGNSRTPTQTTDNYKPLYKTNIVNNRPMLLFDGSNDYMRKLSITSTQPYTVFVVAKPSNQNRIIDLNTGYVSFTASTGYIRLLCNAGSSLSSQTSNVPHPNGVAIGTTVFNTTSSYVAINGGYSNTGSVGSSSGDRIHEGSDSTGTVFYSGYVGDRIIYTGAIDASTRRKIEEYLAWKWAITLVPI